MNKCIRCQGKRWIPWGPTEGGWCFCPECRPNGLREDDGLPTHEPTDEEEEAEDDFYAPLCTCDAPDYELEKGHWYCGHCYGTIPKAPMDLGDWEEWKP